MRYNDVRKPIEYVVDQYFNRKKLNIKNQTFNEELGLIHSPNGGMLDEDLPTHPVHLFRDADNRVERVVYGDLDAMVAAEASGTDHSYILWQEELIRDSTGKVVTVRKTYPDGSSIDNHLSRDANNRLEKFE